MPNNGRTPRHPYPLLVAIRKTSPFCFCSEDGYPGRRGLRVSSISVGDGDQDPPRETERGNGRNHPASSINSLSRAIREFPPCEEGRHTAHAPRRSFRPPPRCPGRDGASPPPHRRHKAQALQRSGHLRLNLNRHPPTGQIEYLQFLVL